MADNTKHENIAEALAAFQAEMPKATKNELGQAGGSRQYKYADLAAVTAAVMPVLTKHGLSYICTPRRVENTEHGYEMHAILQHTSGQSIIGVLPLFGNRPQELGSSITYARRYLLGCLTGVVTEDDDDAAAANNSAHTMRVPTEQELVSQARAQAWAAWKAAGLPEVTDTFRATYESQSGGSFDSATVAGFNAFAVAVASGSVTPVSIEEHLARALNAQVTAEETAGMP